MIVSVLLAHTALAASPVVDRGPLPLIAMHVVAQQNAQSATRRPATAPAQSLTQISGVVRSITREGIVFRVATETGTTLLVAPWAAGQGQSLVDAEIAARGVWMSVDRPDGALVRALLVEHPEQLHVVEDAPQNPFAIAPVRLEEISQLHGAALPRHRIKVTGTVTAHLRRSFYLTDGVHHLEVRSTGDQRLAPGDVVEVLGFVGDASRSPVLLDAMYRRVRSTAPPQPIRLDTTRRFDRSLENTLVTAQARLVKHADDATDHELLLAIDNVTFEAELPATEDHAALESLTEGSLLEVTGIANLWRQSSSESLSLEIELRDAADVRVIASPPWWTPRHAVYLALGLLVGVVAAGGWIVALRRRLPAIEQAKDRAEAALKQRDAELQQAQKMDAIGRLAGGIAHDFNNLLTVIGGNSEFAIEEASHVHGKVPEYLLDIREAARSAAGLTRQLLAFSRKQVIQPTVLDLNLVVAEFEKMLRRLVGEDVQIIVRTAGEPLYVHADRSQLEQVIVNLAVNARDAMPNGGRLVLETGYCGEHTSLAVTDTGCGMPKEVQERIFEPFFTTKELGRGTGLGLAMVYGVVTQSGGAITVESEPGRGTTFTVRLPRVSSPANVVQPTISDRPAGGAETILLVEDEPAVRSLAHQVLSRAGYNVMVASEGHQALRLAETHTGTIDLLLSDLVMPHMSGAQTAQLLQRAQPDTCVLLMSGYTDHPVLRDQPIPEVAELLSKPFTPDGLMRAVRRVLDRRRETTESVLSDAQTRRAG